MTKQVKPLAITRKILLGTSIVLLSFGIGCKNASDDDPTKWDAGKAETTEKEGTAAGKIGIGQPLKTDYFEVTISKADITPKIKVASEYADDIVAEAGNKFLILTTTFKNIDNESRMILDGTVFITYNGKEYKFDNSEVIAEEGYGLFLDQINPLISKSTKLVYKLPAEIKGLAYYQPGRADDDERIFLGEL